MNTILSQLSSIDKEGNRYLLCESLSKFEDFEETDISGETHSYKRAKCDLLRKDDIWTIEAFIDKNSCLNCRLLNKDHLQYFFFIGTVNMKFEQSFLIRISKSIELFVVAK